MYSNYQNKTSYSNCLGITLDQIFVWFSRQNLGTIRVLFGLVRPKRTLINEVKLHNSGYGPISVICPYKCLYHKAHVNLIPFLRV